jgi:hypothetical protein
MGVKVEIHSEDIDNSTRTDDYPTGDEWYFDPGEHGTIRVLKVAKDAESITDEVCLAEYPHHNVIRAYVYEASSSSANVVPKVKELYEEEEEDD